MSVPDFRLGLEQVYGPKLPPLTVTQLKGDASSRSYFRVTVEGASPRTLIVMQLPEDVFGSDEAGSQPASTRPAFLEVAELLAAQEISVPAIYAERLDVGQILLEDLGDATLEAKLLESERSEWENWYARAVDLLAQMHERCAAPPPSSIVAQRRYDLALLHWELDHFREWGLEAVFGSIGPDESATVDRAFGAIVAEMAAMPTGFVHRDYQSRNLMVRPDGSLTIIDFQDAMQGPRVYDLVALLCDSYVSIDLELQLSMIRRYAAVRRIDPTSLEREFWTVCVHRKLKDAGRFVFIDRVRGNPAFLDWFPESLRYVGRALGQLSSLGELERVLSDRIPGFPSSVAKPLATSE